MSRIQKIISTVILAALVIVSIKKVSSFLQLKESDNRYSAYFVEENRIDVLFIGSSHVRHGFFPMELWTDYGISSFNLAVNGSTIPVSYWTLVNALDYQTPEVVVMDIFDMWPGRICSEKWGQVHEAFDAVPLSINKFLMVNDLFNDKELTDMDGNNLYEKRWEILFDLGEYHTRWSTIAEDDFISQSGLERNSSVWKGASPLINLSARSPKEYADSVDGLEYDELSREYLERIIDLCNKRGISLVFINTGYDCSDESKLFADSVYEIAAQSNIPYLDFTKENIINFDSDLDSGGINTHVNFSGAEKFTKYIGTYLAENYRLEDHRFDEDYASWREDEQKFIDSKREYLVSQDNIIYYLMLLADDDYQTIIEIRDRDILYEDGNDRMLQNLGVDYSRIDENCNILVIDNENQAVSYLYSDHGSETSMESVAGELAVFNDGTVCGMALNGNELYTANANEDAGRIRIMVVSKKSGENVDMRIFWQ